MLSPLKFWNVGERDIARKPVLKYDSTIYSSEDSLTHKPPLMTTAHFQLPDSYLNINRLTAVVENIKFDKENVPDALSLSNEHSSVELFKSQSKRNILSESNNRRIIEKAFAGYSDPYAKFPFPSTPKPSTPDILLSPKTPISCLRDRDRYVTFEEKSAMREAAIEGQNDFLRALTKSGKKGHGDVTFLSSKKKSTKRVNFECSTPKVYSAIEISDSPLGSSCIIDTPLSGFKELAPDNISENSFYSFNYSGEPSPSSFQSDNSQYEYSPDKNLPEDVKAILLTGIVCFVDCHTESINRTESVQAELLSLGAKVEKNFTKKVTHVVFKEGKMSTYIKAKKENIPLVGILWIEACKRVRGIADPALHRPGRMQKYDRLLPFQMITKRRLAILNPHSKVRRNLMMLTGETPPPSPKRKKRARKAITDIKGVRKRNLDEQLERHCTKKLFDNCDDKNQYDQILNKICPTDSSTDNSALLKEAARIRRKSAPGKLLSKKTSRREDIKAYFKKLQPEPIVTDVQVGNNASPVKQIEKLPIQAGQGEEDVLPLFKFLGSQQTQEIQEKKKRKLFDPNESLSLSQKSEAETTRSAEPPYLTTPKRARTKVTCGARPLKVSFAHKLHAKAKKMDDMDTDSSPSGMLFTNKPDSQTLKLEQPSITFTSIPKSELPKYNEMVQKLGKFNVSDKVTKHTTHLVSNGPRRTINLIKGIARGCWIVDLKWIIESEDHGTWLSHEKFNLSKDFPAAAECCKVRRSLKSTKVMDIFKGIGTIYVSRKLKGSPHFSDVEELLRLCAGTIVSSSPEADIIIGKKKIPSAVCVCVKWVLDCVTQNLLLPFHDYIESETLSQETQGS